MRGREEDYVSFIGGLPEVGEGGEQGCSSALTELCGSRPGAGYYPRQPIPLKRRSYGPSYYVACYPFRETDKEEWQALVVADLEYLAKDPNSRKPTGGMAINGFEMLAKGKPNVKEIGRRELESETRLVVDDMFEVHSDIIGSDHYRHFCVTWDKYFTESDLQMRREESDPRFPGLVVLLEPDGQRIGWEWIDLKTLREQIFRENFDQSMHIAVNWFGNRFSTPQEWDADSRYALWHNDRIHRFRKQAKAAGFIIT
jgi:hypothetical protein